jgi:hypothetical protein
VHAENGRAEIMLASENSSVRLSDNRSLNSSRSEILIGSAVVITRELGSRSDL